MPIEIIGDLDEELEEDLDQYPKQPDEVLGDHIEDPHRGQQEHLSDGNTSISIAYAVEGMEDAAVLRYYIRPNKKITAAKADRENIPPAPGKWNKLLLTKRQAGEECHEEDKYQTKHLVGTKRNPSVFSITDANYDPEEDKIVVEAKRGDVEESYYSFMDDDFRAEIEILEGDRLGEVETVKKGGGSNGPLI